MNNPGSLQARNRLPELRQSCKISNISPNRSNRLSILGFWALPGTHSTFRNSSNMQKSPKNLQAGQTDSTQVSLEISGKCGVRDTAFWKVPPNL
eukprot:4951788-Pleurochrysis_carterae.AAC.1